MDNLDDIFVQKYVHRRDSSSTATTDLSKYVGFKQKYSLFVKDIIVIILSIMDVPFEKLSEIIHALFGIEVPKERICEIYQDNIRWKIYNNL